MIFRRGIFIISEHARDAIITHYLLMNDTMSSHMFMWLIFVCVFLFLQGATDPTNFVSLAGILDLWPENPISITGNYQQKVQVMHVMIKYVTIYILYQNVVSVFENDKSCRL